MVKTHKKLISLLLAVCMITACFGVPVNGYSADDTDQAYLDMISYFQQQMKNREEDITYTFETNDSVYTNRYDDKNVVDLRNKFYNTLFFDIFKINTTPNAADPFLGDYLYNSVYYAGVEDSGYEPIEGTNLNKFKVHFSFKYYTSLADERYISDFVSAFSQTYIDSSMSDYKKVKTIYDFIVRNTTYDFDVYYNETDTESERYIHSHSALGAICGSLITEENSRPDISLEYDTILSGEKIVKTADQGLAVCEGYAKLFYLLCIYNAIPCRIVDGDYTDERQDPHEWNYVYLDDGVKEDGARWYQVDTTFASQASIKEIDFNNYDYFLKGSGNSFLNEENHQQPYADFSEEAVKEPLYNWYADENISSVEDYEIPYTSFNTSTEAADGYIIRRITDYGVGKGEQIAYIYTDLDKSFLIAVDENRNVIMEEVEGFDYSGLYSRFDVLLPYFIPEYEYHVEGLDGSRIVTGDDVDDYEMWIVGENNSRVKIPFKIVPMDMSNKSDNYSDCVIQPSAPYTGEIIVPDTYITDGYDHLLCPDTENEVNDYSIEFFADEARTIPAELKAMGNYWCDISFHGNYCGKYLFSFQIGKTDLSFIHSGNLEFTYLGAPRSKTLTPADLYVMGAGNLNIGGMLIQNNVDYTVSSSGSLEWGSTGTITLTGVASSEKVEGGTSTSFGYSLKQYDISNAFNGKVYDTNVYYYTGSEVIPSDCDGVSDYLEKGVDYRITGYSNNVNAGEASVTIEGIGGCKGTAVMRYRISPALINQVELKDLKLSNGTFSYTPIFNGTVLQKNIDYTESVEKTSDGYKLTVTGKGNFTESKSVIVKVPTPVNPSDPSNPSQQVIPINTNLTVNKTTLVKLTAKKKKLVVKWSKVGGNVSGYRIEYSRKKNFSGAKKIDVYGAGKTSYTIKKLKSKKKYYVRVRTIYKKGNVLYMSGWSNVKNKKVK